MPEYPYIAIDDPTITQYFFYTMKEVPRSDVIVTDEHGRRWKRLFEIPQASFDSRAADPYSAADFNRRLANKNHTIGQLWDESKELSQKRASKDGKDPIKEKYYDKYAKDRNGKQHSNRQKEILAAKVAAKDKQLKKFGVNINIKT